MNDWLEWLGALGDKETDDAETRLKHRYLVVTGCAMSLGGVIWGTVLFWIGLPGPGSIPFAYTVVTAINLYFLHQTKDFGRARVIQVSISLLLPFLLQWSLGGFVSSGAMMVWAILSLVGSLSFAQNRESLVWLASFLLLTAFSGLIEGELPVPEILQTSSIVKFSFAVNISVVAVTIFGLIFYFTDLRRQAMLELAEKNREIASSQAALVQSEKLAALGQLVAGVAHELNTPLGAIKASVGNLRVAVAESRQELPETLAAATPEERAAWRVLVDRGVEAPAMSTRDERALRKTLEEALEAEGLGGQRRAARSLARLGVAGGVEPFRALLQSEHGEALLKGATNVASMERNATTIQTAADRAAKIVFALKHYAHPGDAAGQEIEASLAENLETVLTLYHNHIKHGVEVIRHLDEPVPFLGRHDELNQVWTNLVHNALQAMDYRGTLEVGVALDDGVAVVTITDSGPGIPDHVQKRMFEPFYTTKPAGEGSGLGLSISRKIVAGHGGEMRLQTQPGRTTFEVRLPREHADA